MSSFTFTWQPKRKSCSISFLEKCGSSVGKIDPPPLVTWQVHCTQVPPPPQAEGRKIPSLLNVVSKEEPPSTSISF